MGRFFGSIHAFAGDDDSSVVRTRVASAVSRWVTAGPFREIDAADQSTVHRRASLLVGQRWISLYCTEAMTSEGSALAEQLARDTGLATLWFYVADGSMLHMAVYETGAELDHAIVDVDPPDAGGALDPMKEPTDAIWKRLLLDEVNGDDLREQWNSTATSAEDKVRAIAALLGLDPSRVDSYLPESRGGESMTLRFTLTDNSPWLVERGNPPKLCLAPYSVFRRHGTMTSGLGPAAIGQLVSCGGEGRGITVDVGGVSVARRQLQNIRVRIQRGGGSGDVDNTSVVDVAPRDGYVVENLEIPRGAANAQMLVHLAAVQASASDVLAALSFRFFLEAETRLRGDGELVMRIVPDANPDGAVAWTVPVSVT